MAEKIKMALSWTMILKLPVLSVIVPFVDPFTEIDTPASTSPDSVNTLPVTLISFCEVIAGGTDFQCSLFFPMAEPCRQIMKNRIITCLVKGTLYTISLIQKSSP